MFSSPKGLPGQGWAKFKRRARTSAQVTYMDGKNLSACSGPAACQESSRRPPQDAGVGCGHLPWQAHCLAKHVFMVLNGEFPVLYRCFLLPHKLPSYLADCSHFLIQFIFALVVSAFGVIAEKPEALGDCKAPWMA